MRRYLKFIIPFALLALLPLVCHNDSILYTANMVLLYAILGISFNMLFGLTGQFSFGHAGLWAVGAYVSAFMTTRLGLPFLAAFVLAIIGGGIIGFLLAFPCRRVKGSYLSLMTWGFAEIVRVVLVNWTPVTGGVNGISNIPSASIGPLVFSTEATFFWLALVIAILCNAVYLRVRDSRIGTAFLAIKQDPLAAGVMGINVPRFKLLSFVLCAMIAAASGSLFAHFLRFVSPDSFTLSVSSAAVQVVLLGGFGSAISPWVGAFIIQGVGELLRGLGSYREVLIGVVVLLVLIFCRDGLVGVGTRLWNKYIASRLPGRKPELAADGRKSS